MPTDEELLEMLARALAPADRAPGADRVAALQAAVARQTEAASSRLPEPNRIRLLRRAPMLAAAAAVAVAFLVGATLAERRENPDQAISVEFEVALRSPAGGPAADVVGIKTGIGRIVHLRSDSLPILPTGEYYEIWFVGPGDTPARPNRISAGTFHPDEQGRSEVELTAAVDPAKYEELSVTAEPGDGNPLPNGPEVLRARLQLRR